MAQSETITGLTCPNCSGVLTVPEGAPIVTCPFCQMSHLVLGERGVRRYQAPRKISREFAGQALQAFWRGANRAPDLTRAARIQELFVVYLPYWRVRAQLAGWMFGRARKDKDETTPAEVVVAEEVDWNDAACDVAEFGVQSVQLMNRAELNAYDGDALRTEGMVFEPTESHTEALEQAQAAFWGKARDKGNLVKRFYEKFHLLREQLALVYYPLWVGRYAYKQRIYQVVIDGHRGDVLYGKAPGNIFYRAAMLVLGMAIGNFVLVNGTALGAWFALHSSDSDDNSFWLPLVILAVGVGIVTWGYQSFRYGEEVQVGGPGESFWDGLSANIQKVFGLVSKWGE